MKKPKKEKEEWTLGEWNKRGHSMKYERLMKVLDTSSLFDLVLTPYLI